jgi:hypothetical protein
MTPQPRKEQLASQPGNDCCAALGEDHLTGEQFGELMAWSTEAASPELAVAEAHLLVCELCAAELANMREAISVFREASSAYADDELRRMPRWAIPERPVFTHRLVPAYWLVAAAMFLTALFPLQVLRRHTLQPVPAGVSSVTDSDAASNAALDAQTDEALLDDVNREVSRSVPASMQALDDPTDEVSSIPNETSDPTTNQRKD